MKSETLLSSCQVTTLHRPKVRFYAPTESPSPQSPPAAPSCRSSPTEPELCLWPEQSMRTASEQQHTVSVSQLCLRCVAGAFSPLWSPVSWWQCCWSSAALSGDPAVLGAATGGWVCYLQPVGHSKWLYITIYHKLSGRSASWVVYLHQTRGWPPWRAAGQSRGWTGQSLRVWPTESPRPEIKPALPPEPETQRTWRRRSAFITSFLYDVRGSDHVNWPVMHLVPSRRWSDWFLSPAVSLRQSPDLQWRRSAADGWTHAHKHLRKTWTMLLPQVLQWVLVIHIWWLYFNVLAETLRRHVTVT